MYELKIGELPEKKSWIAALQGVIENAHTTTETLLWETPKGCQAKLNRGDQRMVSVASKACLG